MDFLSFSADLQSQWWFYAVFALLGACFGSFGAVLIERLPAGRDITTRSACSSCGRTLSWWENIPLVSWLALKGRCRTCEATIPAGLWWAEVVTAVGWAVGALLTTNPVSALGFGALVSFSVVLGAIDWKTSYIAWGPYFGFGVAAWLFTAVGALMAGDLSSLWLGLGVGLGWAIGFEVLGLLFYLIRGVAGLGGGDTWLVFVSAGVATALSGNWVIGVYGVIFGWVIGAVWGVIHVSKYAEGVADPYLEAEKAGAEKAGAEKAEAEAEAGSIIEGGDTKPEGGRPEKVSVGQRAFAFGPALMAGPFVCWLIVELTGFNMGF